VLRAVTFDFWNTIAHSRPGALGEARHRAVAAACESCGTEVEAAVLAATLDEVARRWELAWAEGTHLHPSDAAEMVATSLGVEGASRRAVAEAFLGAAREASIELSPGIGACLEALSERGIRMGIVCDVGFSGGELLRGVLAEEGLLDHFHGWGFSDEVGRYKPAPQIFEAALEALGAGPSESMHVGDLRRTDIAGAAALGMRTVRYRGVHDDRDAGAGVEADFVLDSHDQLPGIVDRALGEG
jgi:putative hydrolase of the HAD superfamily